MQHAAGVGDVLERTAYLTVQAGAMPLLQRRQLHTVHTLRGTYGAGPDASNGGKRRRPSSSPSRS